MNPGGTRSQFQLTSLAKGIYHTTPMSFHSFSQLGTQDVADRAKMICKQKMLRGHHLQDAQVVLGTRFLTAEGTCIVADCVLTLHVSGTR